MNRKKLLILLTTTLLIVLGSGLVFAYALGSIQVPYSDENGNEEKEYKSFENEYITLSYSAEAKLITMPSAIGINPPICETILFSDNFEYGDLNEWDNTSYATATSSKSYEGNYSAYINPSSLNTGYMIKNNVINLSCECDLNISFSVLFTNAFRIGNKKIAPIFDYLVLKIMFNTSKTLVYLIGGLYLGQPSEFVIDLRHQLNANATSVWSVINITDIVNDYKIAFGDDLPKLADVGFYVNSIFGGVYIDDIKIQCSPIKQIISYWTPEGSNLRVIGYYFKVFFTINTSNGVNKSTAFVEIKIWQDIVNCDENKTITEDELIQDAMITPSKFGEEINWTSKTFSLPKDNSIGNTLNYTFDIYIGVFANLNNSSLTVSDGQLTNNFDSFKIKWFSMEALIIIWIGVILSSIGIVITSKKHFEFKKRKKALL